jgi:hypothetical protein
MVTYVFLLVLINSHGLLKVCSICFFSYPLFHVVSSRLQMGTHYSHHYLQAQKPLISGVHYLGTLRW